MTFSTGISSLRAHQTALSVIGNNIANASTEGYRRQQVIFSERPAVEIDRLLIGSGVEVAEIRSATNAAVESALMAAEGEGARLEGQLETARQIDALFIPGTGTLQERTEELFLNLERLSALPTDATLRSAVVHSADAMASELQRITTTIEQMSQSNAAEIDATLEEIRMLVEDVARLNADVSRLSNSGGDPTTARSSRDAAVRELAKLVDVETVKTGDGNDSFLIFGGLFSVDGGLDGLELRRNEDGQLEIWKEGCDEPHTLGSGKFGGLLAQNNGDNGISGITDKLDQFTSALVTHLDGAHATGLGIGSDGFSSLTSTREVEENSDPLSLHTTFSEVTNGRLFISVNDQSSGTTELHAVDVSAESQSLDDLATAISGIDHLTARTNAQGRISIVADVGFTFDFTGNAQTLPDTATISGTTTPTVSGRYDGPANEEYSFRFLGSGTIGVTGGLQVEILNSAGDPVRVADVGTSYEPSSPIHIEHGLNVSLSSGTVADGDEFTVNAVSQPDETGLLAALGLNTLFTGTDAGTLAVNADIQSNPSLLATTTNGDPSDTRNLHRMLDLRNGLLMQDGTVTLEQYLADIAADAGRAVGDLTRDVEAIEEQSSFLQAEVESATGVDVNEELARMLQYQRAYQAAARYIAAVDQSLQQLFTIIR